MENYQNIKFPTEKCLELMVYEEEKIRMSTEYQDECTKVKNIVNGWLDVSADVQKRVANKFGFIDNISCDIAVNMLRRARYIYPNNNIFKTVPVYVRQNKANEGIYKVGDDIDDVLLYSINKDPVNFKNLLQLEKINLVLVSSTT